MNIWDWVHKLENELEAAGQEHASRIIEQLTTEILDLNIAKADALVPEAIALSRSLNNPWLEVFFRHWEMRNRIGNKVEGDTALADVVELFEFSHREETITCPQTVCVTQDLASCYANIDGPGWVEERIAVCNETFERINPKWNCFQCLSCECAEALIDDGKPQEALDFLQQQSEKIIEVGEDIYESMKTFKVQALLKLGKAEQAWEILKKCEEDVDGYDWPTIKQDRQVLKALTQATLGNLEEAWNNLPSWSEMVPRYYMTWIQAAEILAQKDPERNAWQLGSIIQEALNHFVKVGAYRRIIDLAAIQIRLALARNSIWIAGRALKLAKEALPKLRVPKGADMLLEQLTAQINAAVSTVTLPVPANELLAWLEEQGKQNETRNPEQEIALLLLAVKELPNDVQLIDITSSALQALTAYDEAEALLWSYVDKNSQTETNVAYFLLNLLLKQGKFADIDKLAEYFNTIPSVFLWCKIQQAMAQDDLENAKIYALKMHEALPDYLGPVAVLVRAAVRHQDFAEAAKWQTLLVERTEEPRNELWDLLTFSAAIQDWAKAREIAKQLEITLESTEGPFEEDWGWVRIQVEEEGENIEYLARCTGPVTARIQALSHPSKTQRTGDLIVFDAQQLDTPPEDEEERKYFIPLYRLITTLESGNFGSSWFVDGVHPGEETFNAFDAQISELGWRVWVHSNQNYQLTDTFDADETPLQGVFFSVAAPKDISAAQIDQELTKLTEHWQHPVCWLRLAQAANVPVEPHEDIIHQYNL